MPVPQLGDSGGGVPLVGQLQTPDAVDLDRGHREPALHAFALESLEQGHSVDDEDAG